MLSILPFPYFQQFTFWVWLLTLNCRFCPFLASIRWYTSTKQMHALQIMVSHLICRSLGAVLITRHLNSLLKLRIWDKNWFKYFLRGDLLWRCIWDMRWTCWLSQVVPMVALMKKLRSSSGWGILISSFAIHLFMHRFLWEISASCITSVFFISAKFPGSKTLNS